MTSESVENSNSENKNLSEYERIWKRIREQINVTAKDYVRPLYNALISDGYTPKEARDKVKKDAFNIWTAKTIDDEIPIEAKEPIKVLAGQLGQEKKKEQNVLRQTEAEQDPVSQTEFKSAFVPREIQQQDDKPINPIVTIKLGMNDSKDIKKVVNRINLLDGFSFKYNLQTKRIESIQT